MAWRIDEQVVRGELDCRVRGRVTGRFWFVGRDEPVELRLAGTPWRDLAGHLLTFTQAAPIPGDLKQLAPVQEGVVGDITASRKVKVPDCTPEELEALYEARKPFPWHWGNALHLEWFSERNGRVVIESAAYALKLDATATWTMTPGEEAEQRNANGRAMTDFLDRATAALAASQGDAEEDLSEPPQSEAEAKADAESARMDLLMDRVSARLERERLDDDAFDRIWWEERERLRIERGEPAPEPLTPEQEAEEAAWIEELNAVTAEAVEEAEAELRAGRRPERADHPLVGRCSGLGIRLFNEIRERDLLPAGAGEEHPLHEIPFGITTAGAKLAGALNGPFADRQWPPEALYAGDTLVRLKKARGHLRDALRALDSADESNLGTQAWRDGIRSEAKAILEEVRRLIREVRVVLKDDDTAGD